MGAKGLSVPLLLVVGAILLALSHSGEIRTRAEVALGRGMPAREAALARGFVLGEDEQIDEGTTEDFRRAGLSHLLAVSGQNVALLVLLAMPGLAALGLPLRTRLLWVLGLIAVYVPLAGAGPSIQRAGIMGALSVLATMAGRRTSRFYALVFAGVVLLVLEPGIAATWAGSSASRRCSASSCLPRRCERESWQGSAAAACAVLWLREQR